jgi:hypothetical protein
MIVICLFDIFSYTPKYNLFQNNVKFRIPMLDGNIKKTEWLIC